MRTLQLFAALALVSALAGCGSPDPVNATYNGMLAAGDKVLETDNSLYDEYEFKAAEGWPITITMTATAFDAYAHLIDADGNQLASDDDGAGGTNAKVTFVAPKTGTYRAYANSLSGGATGAYTLVVQAGPAGAAPAAPAAPAAH